MDRQSDLENRLQGKKLEAADKQSVEKQFSDALKGLKDKTYSNNPDENKEIKDAVGSIVDDILDGETREGIPESISKENLDKLNAALSKAKDNKDTINWLYGYLTEIDELDTVYQKEIQEVINGTAAAIVTVFEGLKSDSHNFDKTKISLDTNNTPVVTTDTAGKEPEKKTGSNTTVDSGVVVKETEGVTKDNLTINQNTVDNSTPKKDEKASNTSAGTLDDGLTGSQWINETPKPVEKPVNEKAKKSKTEKTLDNNITTVIVEEPNKSTATTIDTDISVAPTGTVEAGFVKGAGEESKEEVAAKDTKRNVAEYQKFEAEGLENLPSSARKMFKEALSKNQITIGDTITEPKVYENKNSNKEVTFRMLFRMIKQVNIGNAFAILKSGVDQKGVPLQEFAYEKNGQIILKSPKAVEDFWKKQTTGEKPAYSPIGGDLNPAERYLLVHLTETFFNIANKAGKETDNDKLFMSTLGVALASDALGKREISKNLAGTQEVSKSLQEKLKDPDMDMSKAIASILGNYNFDKKVDEKDINTITGQQMAAMYTETKRNLMLLSDDATEGKKNAEALMIRNMVDMMIYHIDTKDNGTGKIDWKTVNVKGRDAAIQDLQSYKTEKELLNKISQVPSLILVYQDIFRLAGENASILFLKGKRGYQEVVERKADVDAPAKEEVKTSAFDRPYESNTALDEKTIQEVAKVSPEFKGEVEKHVSAAYDRAVKDLYEKVKEGKYADGTPIPESLQPQVEEAAKALLDEKISGANKKMLTINALGGFINAVKGEEGVGVGANITSEKLNDLLSNPEKGWYNSVNLTPGIYASPDGKPIIGMMMGLQGKKQWTNKGGDHTFMYGAAVGGGMANGKLVFGPSANIGYEEQINGKQVSQSISKEKANYIGAVLAASLTEVGVGLYFRKDEYRAIEQQQQSMETNLVGLLQTAVKSAEGLDSKSIAAAIQKQFPKSNKDDVAKMADNLSAVIKPYLFDATSKAELQSSLDGFGKGAQVDAVIAQVMEDVAKLYALDWRNHRVSTMKRFQMTELGIGKSLSLNAADPVGSFVKNILPIYVGVGATIYSKPRYRELAWSRKNANDLLINARGVNANDIVAKNWSEKVSHLNMVFQDIASEGQESSKKKPDVSADGKTDTNVEAENPTEYFTKSGDNVLIDPAVLSLKGMNVSLLQTYKPYIGYKDGKLVVPSKIPVMFTTTHGGKGMSYDLIIGTVGLENAISVKSFDQFANGKPENIGDLGSIVSVDSLISTIKNSPEESMKLVNNIANFTTVESLGATTEYKDYVGKMLVTPQKGVALDAGTLKPVEIKGVQYYVIENPGHAQIIFDQDKTRPGIYTMNVTHDTSKEMMLHYKGYVESKVITQLSQDMESKVPEVVKEFLNGPTINSLLLSKEIHDGYKGKKSQKDELVDAIQKASTNDNEAEWIKAGNQANTMIGKNLFVWDANNPNALKDSLRYFNAKMALTPAARDRDIERYKKYKDNAESDIIKLPASGKGRDLLDKLYATGSLTAAENKELKTILGDKNILKTVAYILDKRAPGMPRRLKNEGVYTQAGINAFQSAWKQSADQLGGKDKVQVYSGKSMQGAIGMVFGYEGNAQTGQYDEKFVVHPKLATSPTSQNEKPDSYVEVNNSEVRAHFLNNLKTEEQGLLDRILEPLVDDACGKIKCYKGQVRESVINQFIEGMKTKSESTVNITLEDGKTASFQIKAKFGHAFYNECFNETIVMSDIQVIPHEKTIKGDTKMDNQGALYVNAYNTVGELYNTQKKVSLAGLFGNRQKQEENYTSGTDTGNGEHDGGTDTGNNGNGNWDDGSAGDIPGSGPTNPGAPDIPNQNPTPTQTYQNVMNQNGSLIYPTIVGAVNHNGLSQNIKVKADQKVGDYAVEKEEDKDSKKKEKNEKKDQKNKSDKNGEK